MLDTMFAIDHSSLYGQSPHPCMFPASRNIISQSSKALFLFSIHRLLLLLLPGILFLLFPHLLLLAVFFSRPYLGIPLFRKLLPLPTTSWLGSLSSLDTFCLCVANSWLYGRLQSLTCLFYTMFFKLLHL